jgi:hypothetical protein
MRIQCRGAADGSPRLDASVLVPDILSSRRRRNRPHSDNTRDMTCHEFRAQAPSSPALACGLARDDKEEGQLGLALAAVAERKRIGESL